MNCQEVIAILDDQRVDGLDLALRRQAEAHVATCNECARAWHVQLDLAALPGITMPAGFAASCRKAVGRGPVPVARRATRSVLLASGLMVLAAAAAMLTFVNATSAPSSPDPALKPQGVQEKAAREAGYVEEATADPQRSGVQDGVGLAAREIVVQLQPLEVPSEQDAADAQEFGADRRELQRTYADPARKQALLALHAAVLEELRAIPGLRLVDRDPREAAPGARGYRLKIGVFVMSEVSGRLISNEGELLVSFDATPSLPARPGSRPWFSLDKINLGARCSGAVTAGTPTCLDPRTVAARLVANLRREVLPPDALQLHALQSGFGDSSRDPAQRASDLLELLAMQARAEDSSLLRDKAVVRAAIQLAATGTPAIRAQVWRGMRGAGATELIDPLVNSLQQDPDDARLAAIETLGADFTGDARARAALQAAALEDPRPLARAVAQRTLSGEESWRRYLLASLQDPRLAAAGRLEALMYHLYPPAPKSGTTGSHPEYFDAMAALLDDDAVRAVARALPDAGRLQGDSHNFLGNFASRYRQFPEVTDMLLRVLEHNPIRLNRLVAVEVFVGTRNNDPRVKDALARAMASDPEQEVRDSIRRLTAAN